MFFFWGGTFFTGVYVDLARRFLHPEILTWWTYTGSSYNSATENDIKVISAAATIFQGTPDPSSLATALSD